MGGEMMREAKVSHSPMRDPEVRAQWLNPSPLTPRMLRQYIFFFLLILDPCLYLVFAQSQGDHAHRSLPGPSFLPVSWFLPVSQESPVPHLVMKFPLFFSKDLSCQENPSINDARWF